MRRPKRTRRRRAVSRVEPAQAPRGVARVPALATRKRSSTPSSPKSRTRSDIPCDIPSRWRNLMRKTASCRRDGISGRVEVGASLSRPLTRPVTVENPRRIGRLVEVRTSQVRRPLTWPILVRDPNLNGALRPLTRPVVVGNQMHGYATCGRLMLLGKLTNAEARLLLDIGCQSRCLGRGNQEGLS